MKTLREISEEEQLEALAGDPWADLNDRVMAMEHLKAMRKFEAWKEKTRRDADLLIIVIACLPIIFVAVWIYYHRN